jgi:hypothetical protein
MAIPLISTPDSFESIRDKIAEILAANTTLQQVLATAAGQDPDDWAYSVYVERSRPWEAFVDGGDATPIVNVWYDSSSVDMSVSNSEDRQMYRSRYRIDCFAIASSQETETGHIAGDESAAKRAHRIGRIVRRILMHPMYMSLGLTSSDDVIWERFVTSMTAFQPGQSDHPVQNVMGFRVDVEVRHSEYTDPEEENMLEEINIQLYHEPDGLLRAELMFEE